MDRVKGFLQTLKVSKAPPPPEPAWWQHQILQPLLNTSVAPWDVVIKTIINLGLCALVWAVMWGMAPRSWTRAMRASWALKALSAVHAVAVAVPAIYALLYEPTMAPITAAVRRWDAEGARMPLVYAPSDIAAIAVPVTLAYFIFDLLLIPVWEGTFVLPVFLHHGLSLLTWPVGLSFPICHWFLLCCLTMEASTPFVQARWFILQHIGKDTTIYVVNGLMMMAAFFACRVVPVLPFNVWAVYIAAAHAEANLPLYARAASACLILPNILNLYWASLMLKGFAKLFLKGGGKKKQPEQQPQPAKEAALDSGGQDTSKLQRLKAA